MTLPKPQPGLVVQYAYLWRDEAARGQVEGLKDRPCAVVLTTQVDQEREWVLVAPITHSRPADSRSALEVPPLVKRHLGLDDAPSWIICTEANRFLWPGPDLRPVPGSSPPRFAHGFLPPRVFSALRDKMIAHIRANLFRQVERSL